MDQIAIGQFIARKRKEQNLTQDQLAERLCISNKTVSKWETGKCMPDYAIIERLCHELKITLAELLDAEEDEKSIHTYDNQQILAMLEETQRLKRKKTMLIGIVLLLMGPVFLACSQFIRGSEVLDVLSGFLLGLSFPHMLLGVVLVVRSRIGKTKGIGVL